MRTLLAVGLILVVVCLAVAPYPAHAAGMLRIAQNTTDLRSMDPHFATTTEDRSLVDMIFNGLVRYKPGDGSVFEPDLSTALPTPKMEAASRSGLSSFARASCATQRLACPATS